MDEQLGCLPIETWKLRNAGSTWPQLAAVALYLGHPSSSLTNVAALSAVTTHPNDSHKPRLWSFNKVVPANSAHIATCDDQHPTPCDNLQPDMTIPTPAIHIAIRRRTMQHYQHKWAHFIGCCKPYFKVYFAGFHTHGWLAVEAPQPCWPVVQWKSQCCSQCQLDPLSQSTRRGRLTECGCVWLQNSESRVFQALNRPRSTVAAERACPTNMILCTGEDNCMFALQRAAATHNLLCVLLASKIQVQFQK